MFNIGAPEVGKGWQRLAKRRFRTGLDMIY